MHKNAIIINLHLVFFFFRLTKDDIDVTEFYFIYSKSLSSHIKLIFFPSHSCITSIISLSFSLTP